MTMQQQSVRIPRNKLLEHGVPHALRPIFRAYVLGYASSTVPRIMTLALLYIGRRSKGSQGKFGDHAFGSLKQILKGGLEIQRFPTFCALLVGGSTLFEIPFRRLFALLSKRLSQVAQVRLAKWTSAFVAGWLGIKLLQSKKSVAYVENAYHDTSQGRVLRPTHFAGRTLDLTLFAVMRALDVIVGELWSQRKDRRTSARTWNKLDTAVGVLADPIIFASSCALIMWAWIYTPDRLPRSYNKWIKSAAAVDPRLVEALRKTRYGELKYGEETGQANVLQDMCKDYNWPLDYGDPVKSIPFPCEVVHMGTGKNCEYHALSRFRKSFLWAMSTYLPLNLILTARNPSPTAFKNALKSSAKSSAFLGTFIALFYYGVCLGRTRLGPHMLGTDVVARRKIDSGFCVGIGCALCGWSVLLENANRRKELGLFVAPRALATLLPRRYLPEHQWRETLAFAMSVAVVFTCVSERPERVRGVLGKLLHRVLAQ